MAATIEVATAKRLIRGSFATVCYVVSVPWNYFRQNADLLDLTYCICRRIADNSRVRQANDASLKQQTGEQKMKVGSKINAASSNSQIFVGRDGIGFVFILKSGALADRRSLMSATQCISVENRGDDWYVVEDRDVPQGAFDLARKELAKKREDFLGCNRRRVSTNSSWDAARSRGVVVRIWTAGSDYVCDVHDWSRWEGDSQSRKDEAAFSTLEEARQWAEKRCETRPSFGDVEWC